MSIEPLFNDWRYRWSRIARSGGPKAKGRWIVNTKPPTFGNTNGEWRLLRWWSPRDLIRIPLHHLWARRYW